MFGAQLRRLAATPRGPAGPPGHLSSWQGSGRGRQVGAGPRFVGEGGRWLRWGTEGSAWRWSGPGRCSWEVVVVTRWRRQGGHGDSIPKPSPKSYVLQEQKKPQDEGSRGGRSSHTRERAQGVSWSKPVGETDSGVLLEAGGGHTGSQRRMRVHPGDGTGVTDLGQLRALPCRRRPMVNCGGITQCAVKLNSLGGATILSGGGAGMGPPSPPPTHPQGATLAHLSPCLWSHCHPSPGPGCPCPPRLVPS